MVCATMGPIFLLSIDIWIDIWMYESHQEDVFSPTARKTPPDSWYGITCYTYLRVLIVIYRGMEIPPPPTGHVTSSDTHVSVQLQHMKLLTAEVLLHPLH